MASNTLRVVIFSAGQPDDTLREGPLSPGLTRDTLVPWGL